jgi:hypothetical protein
MVPVMMSIERETDWFVSDRANLGKNVLCTGRKVGVNHQDIVLEDDPAVVAVAYGNVPSWK